jgi:hypothetical protein
VPFHQFGNIKLWLFQDFDLADEAILDGKDSICFTLNLFANGCTDQLLDERLQITLGAQLGHDSGHFETNGTDLCRVAIASRLDLIVLWAGEGNAKHSDNVSIGCSTIDGSFNNGLLFSDQGAELVTSHVHTMEIHEAIESLDVFDTKLDLSVRQGFILVQVGQTNLDHAALEVVGSNLGSHCFGDESATAILLGKDGRSNQFVPFLTGKGINCLFTASLFGLCQSLVLALLVTMERKENGENAIQFNRLQ